MRKITDFIVNHCYVIFAVFLALTGVCGILATKVKINKDIYNYMPADSETSLGLNIMNDEFDYSATSEYEMMLTDVPAEEKTAIKEHIESVEGVSSVDYGDSDEFNRDNYTRYRIHVDAPADSETANHIYRTIHDEYSSKYEVAEAGRVFSENGDVLQISVALLAVGFAMVILTIMSKSWVEPWLFLFAILLAVVVNKGTNIIFPNVSHITDSIAAILQMALSMDYAIMLSTRYRQEKSKDDCPDNKTAMRRAMRYSFGAISSSSVTTVVGLIVLVVMSFTIGRDMGLVLSKGVILSLVSIFTSLPALLLIFDKAIEKTAKPTINFNMAWFGRRAFNIRHIALPLFLLIFVGSFVLKGSTVINFTASQNNKIKDVFDQTNQMVVIYNSDKDDEVTKICKEYDAREDTTRVLCYGNTINEPEKYNEVVPKINDLSDEKVETEDYLIKAIYYHYYRDGGTHTITLPELVNFLQKEVFGNERFAGEVTDEIVEKVNRFSNFTDQKKVNQPRTKQDIASILGVDPAKLDDVYVLYYSEHQLPTKLRLYDFASFVTNEILTDSNYSSMISASQKSDLAKLLNFSNSKITDTKKSAAELSKLFGIDQSKIEQILIYYNYTNTETPTATSSIENLINFALNNQSVLSALNLSEAKANDLKAQFADIKADINAERENISTRYAEFNTKLDEAIAKLPAETQNNLKPLVEKLRSELSAKVSEINTAVTKEYSYSDIENAAGKINGALDATTYWLDNLEANYPEVFAALDETTKNLVLNYAAQIRAKAAEIRTKADISNRLEKIKSIYKLYQAETTASTAKATPRELVNFLISHANDEKLSGSLNAETLRKLRLAQYIMNNQSTGYTAGALATAFGLDAEKINLVYALYNYRHVNNDPRLSLKTLVNFIAEKILPNPEYANRLSEDQQTQLSTVATLMHAAENGVAYNYESLYRAILPVAKTVNKNQLFLVYLYHGSLYDYDENWTLTLETFINYLNDSILPDSRFAERITDETREKVINGKKTISDSKDMLVGPKHNRMLVESNLDPEGEKTFTFIRELKEKLGPKNKQDYFLVGDSAMAYEMSQSFSGEMDFITILTMLSIFAVVALTFRSVFVSILLVFVIQCAVYIVMAFLSLTGSDIYFIALIIVQAILMGATIDYAILFTSYYVENRSYFKLGIKDALIHTYNKSIGAILTSASILIIVTAIVGRMATAIAATICSSISLGTLCATIIILVLLPPLLAILDRFIVKQKK